MKDIENADFWNVFDGLVKLNGRYSLPSDEIIEEGLETHGLEKMFALFSKILADHESETPTIKKPMGFIISTLRGNIDFPSVAKKRTKVKEPPNWYKQSLEDIRQFEYYVVYDSNNIRQKDITLNDIKGLLDNDPIDTDAKLLDRFWTVYGCLKMLKVPSMNNDYPGPELSICKSFTQFSKLRKFFQSDIEISDEHIEVMKRWVKKHAEGRDRFASSQPGLIHGILRHEGEDNV